LPAVPVAGWQATLLGTQEAQDTQNGFFVSADIFFPPDVVLVSSDSDNKALTQA
jgi:hypothetical protein